MSAPEVPDDEKSVGAADTTAGRMSPHALADALERRQMEALNAATVKRDSYTNLSLSEVAALDPRKPVRYPTVEELDGLVTSRAYRRGLGRLFWNRSGGMVERLAPMPAAPRLSDFFALRFPHTAQHCLQSANKAMQRGEDEEIVLACLLHDIAQEVICAEHAAWAAQLVEPYVSERISFAIRYHQTLRFFADESAGYAYPAIYLRLYGEDFVPDERLQKNYQFVRNHRWYDAARAVTVSDLYGFDPNSVVKIEAFIDIIGRHFKEPKDGLGQDNSPVAHMWRTLANPDAPL